MKLLGLILTAVMLFVVTGCATTLLNKSTVKEMDPTGTIVLKQTNNDFTYQESQIAKKSLAAGGSVTAIKVVTAADSNTGSFMPTFILGFGTYFMFDLAPGESAYFHDSQKSMWTSEVASDTTVLMYGSNNQSKIEISNPELIIDVPGLKIQNPLSDSASTKTVVAPHPIRPMGVMPSMPAMPSTKAPESK